MQSEKQLIVLKFGSSVLRSENDLPTAVHEIYRWWREGFQVVAVVSAFGNTTDELTQRAHSACEQPNDELVAALLATGEAASSALLGLALNRSGIQTTVLDAEQAGLATEGPALDANLTSLDAARVLEALRHGVVVLPGFVGRGKSGKRRCWVEVVRILRRYSLRNVSAQHAGSSKTLTDSIPAILIPPLDHQRRALRG